MDKDTVFINTMANPFWEPLLMVWEKLGWKMSEGKHIRIKYSDLRLLIKGSGMKTVKHDYRLLIPIEIPFVTSFINKYFEKTFKRFAFLPILNMAFALMSVNLFTWFK